MTELEGGQFRTATKAIADIMGGGNFLWQTFYDQLIFNRNGQVELHRITTKENGLDTLRDTVTYTGTFKKPNVGRYTADIELTSLSMETSLQYCEKLIDDNTLVCHGYIVGGRSYETEIFNEI